MAHGGPYFGAVRTGPGPWQGGPEWETSAVGDAAGGPLFGRDADLRRLRALATSAAGGRGTTVTRQRGGRDRQDSPHRPPPGPRPPGRGWPSAGPGPRSSTGAAPSGRWPPPSACRRRHRARRSQPDQTSPGWSRPWWRSPATTPTGSARRGGAPADGAPPQAGCWFGLAQRVKLNSALWVVPSMRVTVSWRHVPAHALSVFQV